MQLKLKRTVIFGTIPKSETDEKVLKDLEFLEEREKALQRKEAQLQEEIAFTKVGPKAKGVRIKL